MSKSIHSTQIDLKKSGNEVISNLTDTNMAIDALIGFILIKQDFDYDEELQEILKKLESKIFQSKSKMRMLSKLITNP